MIPRTRTLRVEDFPDQSDWIEPIVRAINDQASQTSSALSSSLTFGENFNATLQDIEITMATDWMTPSLGNGWVTFGGNTPRYRRVGSFVQMVGVVSTGTLGAAAFTLPVGYRPPIGLQIPTVSFAAFGYMFISAAGAVSPTAGSTSNFDINTTFGVDGPGLPNAAFPVTFAHKLKGGAKPAGVLVIGVRDLTSGARTPLSGSGYCAWRPNGAEVIVDDVPGLIPDRKYRVTFLVVGG